MKVLVTGINGQLGFDVMHFLKLKNHEGIGVDIDDMDLTNEEQVRDFVLKKSPDAIIHCAAYTAVDKAEDQPELCRAVNYYGTRYLAEAAKELDIKMTYISTDYVFSGEGVEPFKEYDGKDPKNIYGKTKLEGENVVVDLVKKHFIVRISWAFGINGNNFIKTMLKIGKERDKLQVVNDQIGSPTYTYDVAKLLVDMIETDKYGVYHGTNDGYCSWYEFAKEIFAIAGYSVEVEPVDSATFVTKAERPKNSRLSREKLVDNGFEILPSWQDALRRYLEDVL